MKSRIKNIVTGLCNLWKWRKVIYKDRDWDHYYIYEILKTKLKFQAEHFKKHGITESSEDKAKEMMECIDLIDNIQNERYIDEAMHCLYNENWTDEQFNEAINKHDKVRKQVFDTIERNIESWWD